MRSADLMVPGAMVPRSHVGWENLALAVQATMATAKCEAFARWPYGFGFEWHSSPTPHSEVKLWTKLVPICRAAGLIGVRIPYLMRSRIHELGPGESARLFLLLEGE